jgi:transposase
MPQRKPAMEHIGIDLGGRESQVCIRDAEGTILLEKKVPTRELEAFLLQRPRSMVVCETCSESFEIAAAAQRAGHDVKVVPATLARTLGVGLRGIKTDRRDAQALSAASSRIELPSIHLRSVASRTTSTVMGMRDGLVTARTQLINTVRGWLRTKLIPLRSGDSTTFSSRVKDALEQNVPSFVSRQLDALDALSAQIKAADQEIKAVAESDLVCQRLMTVPGVGPFTAALFVATVDTVERFPNVQQLQSYLGLTPGERSSSTVKRRTSITKAGPAELRRLLTQAAWANLAMRHRLPPLAVWGEQVALRRGKKIAVTAMCRKLSGMLFAIWRDGTTYDSSRVIGALPIREVQLTH